MPPTRIMIIRHAEKPPKGGGAPFGVDPDGGTGGENLIVRGWQRAGALVRFFAPDAGHMTPPSALFAAGTGGTFTSLRSRQTVTPLGDLLGIAPDTRFAPDQVEEAAAAMLAQSGIVLAAWEHHNIGRLVDAIAKGKAVAPYWSGHRFDVVLVLDRTGEDWRLAQVPQLLLPGDSDEPLRPRAPGEAD